MRCVLKVQRDGPLVAACMRKAVALDAVAAATGQSSTRTDGADHVDRHTDRIAAVPVVPHHTAAAVAVAALAVGEVDALGARPILFV